MILYHILKKQFWDYIFIFVYKIANKDKEDIYLSYITIHCSISSEFLSHNLYEHLEKKRKDFMKIILHAQIN